MTLYLGLTFKNTNKEEIMNTYLDFIEVEGKDRDYLIEWYSCEVKLTADDSLLYLLYKMKDVHDYDIDKNQDNYIFDTMSSDDWERFSKNITKITFGVSTDIENENIGLENSSIYFNEHEVELDKNTISFRTVFD